MLLGFVSKFKHWNFHFWVTILLLLLKMERSHIPTDILRQDKLTFQSTMQSNVSVTLQDSTITDNEKVVRLLENDQGISNQAVSFSNLQFKTLELPNPIEQLIQKFPVFEIHDAEQAFRFLRQLMLFQKQALTFQLSDVQVLQIMLSRAKGHLLDMIVKAISTEVDIKQFQQSLIKYYIPDITLHQLIGQYYFRTQGIEENFLDYAEDIEIVASALLLPFSEKELVSMVGAGARLPEVRGLFLSTSPPVSWEQLKEIAIKLNNMAALEQYSPAF